MNRVGANLHNKRILIIGPKFFGFENTISDEMRRRGASVEWLYENMTDANVIYRAIPAIFRSLKKSFAERYYSKRLQKISKTFDIVLVIRGEYLSRNTVDFLRAQNPGCLFYMYLWDGVVHNPNSLSIASFFDRVLTFDMVDAQQYGWQYCPLFYTEESEAVRERDIDISYICTLHSQRAKIYFRLKELAKKKGYRIFTNLFMNRIYFMRRRYIHRDKAYTGIPLKDVKHTPFPMDELNTIYHRSKVVLDYVHPGQNGFTMRTIESIGHRCKLATNHERVKQYDFYDEDNVYIYDPEDFYLPESFVLEPYKTLGEKVYEYYSLDSWVDRIFGDA